MAKIDAETPVTGTIWKILTSIGDSVTQGHTLLIVEAMKMEIPIEAPASGTLTELMVNEGDMVSEDDIVAVIETA